MDWGKAVAGYVANRFLDEMRAKGVRLQITIRPASDPSILKAPITVAVDVDDVPEDPEPETLPEEEDPWDREE